MECRLEPGGRPLVCALSTLEVGDDQIVKYSPCLPDIPPERWVVLVVEFLGGEQLRDTRFYTVLPHHENGPVDVRTEDIRSYLPGDAGSEGLTLWPGIHYIDRGSHYVLS